MTIERKFGIVRAASPLDAGIWSQLWRGAHLLAERVLRLGRREPRRLRLCESLPLGERRFVAVVEFDRSRFLVGGTPTSLALLARLEDAGSDAIATRVDEDEQELR
jgi:flagellar biogenesis protein FliO